MSSNLKVTNWRVLISEALSERHETWQDIIACTITEAQLDDEFDADADCIYGRAFTLWTYHYIYFPIHSQSDWREWVVSVPRHPSLEEVYDIANPPLLNSNCSWEN